MTSHTDEMDEAIAELRQRFHLERVRDSCKKVHHCYIKEQFMCDQSCIHPKKSHSLSLPLLSLQGTAADRFFLSLSNFIHGMDTQNIVKVSEHMQCTDTPVTQLQMFVLVKKKSTQAELKKIRET